MKRRSLFSYATIGYLCVVIFSSPVYANLQQLIDQGVFNDLETQAAEAALITYNRLIDQAGCTDRQITDGAAVGGSCSGQTFLLFSNVREIIHTANDLTGQGPTAFSLGSDVQGLGFTLRWTAAEEYAAQGNLSSDFVGGQVSGLATRLTALRAGASGFNVLGIGSREHNNNRKIASRYRPRGAGASGDNAYSPWGGFINLDFGRGNRVATDLEDAFDFENSQVTLGFDYRYGNNWVFGSVFGKSSQEIDFDASQSIVEGKMEADGTSIMPFAMYLNGNWFVSAALGWQNMNFLTTREIRYPSFNPDISSTDTTAVSDADASLTSLFAETGYTFNWRAFSLEPYINLKNTETSVDAFVEDDLNDTAFDLVVNEQNITSLQLSYGTKLQYVFTPSFGVFVPYLNIESVQQTDDAPRTVQARYAQDVSSEASFGVPTEALDSNYLVFTIGTSAVLRGGRERSAGGPVGGDIQAFMNYRTIENLKGFTIEFYSLGLRYTF